MKKLLIAVVLLCVGSMIYAQKSNIKKAQSILEENAGNLSEAWTMIEQATTDAETKDNPKTWLVRAMVLHAVGNSKDTRYSSISKGPFKDAYLSLRKANDSDSIKKKIDDDLKDEYQKLLTDAFKKGREIFGEKNFAGTLSLFELVLEIEKMPYYKGLIDTSVIYNAGVAANNAGQFDKALKYLKQAYDLKYTEENIYGQLSVAYSGIKDSTHALGILKEGYAKFPNNEYLLNSLLIYYVNSGDATDAKKLIQIAKDKNPKSQLIYFAEAKMYENIGDIDKAADSYEACIRILIQAVLNIISMKGHYFTIKLQTYIKIPLK